MGSLETAAHRRPDRRRVSRYLPRPCRGAQRGGAPDGERPTLTLWTDVHDRGRSRRGLDLLKELLFATDCTDTAALKTQVGLMPGRTPSRRRPAIRPASR